MQSTRRIFIRCPNVVLYFRKTVLRNNQINGLLFAIKLLRYEMIHVLSNVQLHMLLIVPIMVGYKKPFLSVLLNPTIILNSHLRLIRIMLAGCVNNFMVLLTE